MAHTIDIEFNKGKATISVKGQKGKSCVDLTKDFEKELGTTTTRETTKEYHEQPLRDQLRQR